MPTVSELIKIIIELENENKELCKQLGILYRPRFQYDAGGFPEGV